uniref:Mpv17-like protein n=1 Tax=Callorhinchus milii TaxID=7868 RepID=V9L6S4_CALMI
MLRSIRSGIKRFPWITNVTLYSCVFGAGDVVQQNLSKEREAKVDLKQTRNILLLTFSFHGNFNFLWLKTLERMLPGVTMGNIVRKVLCDQLFASPVAISAFYVGMSALEGQPDIFGVCREKFWNSYKIGVAYWSVMQAINFTFVPPYVRTAFAGFCCFFWAIFMSFTQQRGNGTVFANLLKPANSGSEGKKLESENKKDNTPPIS